MSMNVSKEKLWGEFEDSNDDVWEDHSLSASDLDELLTPQLYPPTSASVHQPSSQLTSSFQILSGESCQSDVTVQNTIRLLQHTRHVSSMINVAQSAISGSPDNPPLLQPCPPIPTEISLPRTPIGYQPLNFLPPQSTAFTRGREGGVNLEIEQNTARKMLKQSVALVCAHTGFTETTDSVLRTLTDLTHDFMCKLTKMYRTNVDNAKTNDNYSGFHDVLEQTMQEAGVGGMLDLHNMYKDRVQNYYNNVKANALQLSNHYGMMANKQQLLQQQHNNIGHTIQLQNTRRDTNSSNNDWWQQQTSSNANTNQQISNSTNTIQLATSKQGNTITPYTNVIPTAGGGSINITIGGVPGMTFPNISDDNQGRGVLSRSNSAGGRPAATVVRSSSIGSSLDHFNPSSIQSESDIRNQSSPISTHFTINPR